MPSTHDRGDSSVRSSHRVDLSRVWRRHKLTGVLESLFVNIIWEGIKTLFRWLRRRRRSVEVTCYQRGNDIVVNVINRLSSPIKVYDVRLMFCRSYGYRPKNQKFPIRVESQAQKKSYFEKTWVSERLQSTYHPKGMLDLHPIETRLRARCIWANGVQFSRCHGSISTDPQRYNLVQLESPHRSNRHRGG